MRKAAVVICLLALGAFRAGVLAQEPSVVQPTTLHVVAFTLNAGVTDQDVDDLRTATETLVKSVPGMRRAWVGKLRQPLQVGELTRTHGLVLEFDNVQAREAYSKHPNRAPWAKYWDKVRASSTIVDVIGE